MTEVAAKDKKESSAVSRRDLNGWLVYLYCLVITLFFMFFFGLNSPIHTFNAHSDYQWYLTMGRGLVAGKIPYRDLFEQKGPIVYFVYAVASLFPNPQYAVWVFECISVSLFLFFAYRIARKFASCYLSLAVVPLVMMMLSVNFVRAINGAAVEEFCLPIFAYALSCFLDFLLGHHVQNWRRGLALGICLGILLWVKYLTWEFFFLPMLIWLILNLARRNFMYILRTGLLMLGGILIITIPILIYFGAVGALSSLWEVYFITNMGSYSGHDTANVLEYICSFEPWITNAKALFVGPYFVFMFLVGILVFAIRHKKQKGWLIPLAAIGSWLMTGFFCGYGYYYIPLFSYGILGAVYLVKLVHRLFISIDIVICRQWVCRMLLCFVVIGSFCMALPGVLSLKEINRPRNDYAPLVLADIIAEYNETAEKPATLFTYRIGDIGFYNAAGVIPNVRYWAQNCFTEDGLPEMYAAFDETIQNQVCDFVVLTKEVFFKRESFLTSYYDFYYDSLEDSTLFYKCYDGDGYRDYEFIILFRK